MLLHLIEIIRFKLKIELIGTKPLGPATTVGWGLLVSNFFMAFISKEMDQFGPNFV